ncbi:MAG: hypothetical protein ABI648_07070 [Betaproteobacteria bacterium]|jgi:hypothetical protein
MSTIVAGNFEIKAEADSAIEALLSGGINADHICSFAVNPPGQHDAHPMVGDEYASPGATRAGGGSIKGAAVGTAIGMGAGVVALPIAGPAGMAGGAAIGAYVGSLLGALNSMGEDVDPAHSVGTIAARPAGVLVAVGTPLAADRNFATDLLRKRGARDVEIAEGTWRDGSWVDFNPVRDQPATSKAH